MLEAKCSFRLDEKQNDFLFSDFSLYYLLYKSYDTFQQLIEILRNKLMLCPSIPTSGFPHLLYFRCKLGITFARRCFRDVHILINKGQINLFKDVSLCSWQPIRKRGLFSLLMAKIE